MQTPSSPPPRRATSFGRKHLRTCNKTLTGTRNQGEHPASSARGASASRTSSEGGTGHLGRADRSIGLERRSLTNCSGLTTVPKTVPTPSTKPCAVAVVACLMTGGFTPENIAQYSLATLSAFGFAVTTNQEVAGSSPAGRANLYRGFFTSAFSEYWECTGFCTYP